MSQRTATITSLPTAFEVVKAMQVDGLEPSEGCRPLGRRALEEIIEDQMAAQSTAISTSLKRTRLPIALMAIIGGIS